MQAQEQKLAVLVDRLLRLQASAASPRQRESLIMRTMSEINDMRRTVPHISPKVCRPVDAKPAWAVPLGC